MYFSRNQKEIYNFLSGDFDQWTPGMCYFAPGKPIFMGRETIDQQYSEFVDGLKRDGSGNLDRGDKWSFCLTAARVAAEQERR